MRPAQEDFSPTFFSLFSRRELCAQYAQRNRKDIYATSMALIVKSSSITLCPFLQDRSIFPGKISKDTLHSFPEALSIHVSGIPQLNLLMTETLLSRLNLKLGSKYIRETY